MLISHALEIPGNFLRRDFSLSLKVVQEPG